MRVAAELDAAGFPDATITLSNQLDELTIWQIRQQVAEEAAAAGLDPRRVLARLAYGVGTRLITSHGAPALDGVCKLVAVEDGGRWLPSAKRSDSPEKATIPGAKALHRVYDERGMATADLATLRARRERDEARLDAGVRRLRNPHRYHVSLSERLLGLVR